MFVFCELGAMSDDELAQLRQLEESGAARKGALEAIDAASPPPSQDAKSEEDDPAPKPANGRSPNAGPLDIEQMDWRNRHLKPVRHRR
jgi:hypothetical protein